MGGPAVIGARGFRSGAAAVLVVAGVLPAIAALQGALSADFGVLASPELWLLLLRTLGRAIAVTMLALATGVPLGAAFARLRIPCRQLVFALHVLPCCLPLLLPALGWFHLLGAFGLRAALFNEGGAIMVLTAGLLPIVTASTWLGVRSVAASIEEAGLVVAPPLRVLARIVVPAAWPAIVMGALLVFVLAFGDLAVPMFLRVPAYPAAVFARLAGISHDPGEAAVLVLPLLPIALSLFALAHRFLSPRAGAILGIAARPPLRLSAREPLIASVAIAGALFPALPIIGLASRARFAGVVDWIGPSLENSLTTAVFGAAIITAIGIVIGHAQVRSSRLGRIMDATSLLLFITPPALLGVGLISLWNRPVLRSIYGSTAIVVIGFVARYAVVGISAAAASFSRSSASFEDAARIAGASYFRIMRRILLPMHARLLIGSFLLALIFCLRDVETAILYYPPGGETLPVRIFTLEANGPEAVVAGLALLQVGLTACLLIAAWSIARLRR